MKILLHSAVFLPQTGGIEWMAVRWATLWQSMGHDVTVTTEMAAETVSGALPFPVWHRLPVGRWRKLARQADVVVLNHFSMRALGRLLGCATPRLLVIHTRVHYTGLRGQLRGWWLRRERKWAVSAWLASTVPGRPAVVPNLYDEAVFYPGPRAWRERAGILFVGRLVSDKGADLLLEALAHWPQDQAPCPTVTLVGDGPERGPLQARAAALGLGSTVVWAGELSPAVWAERARAARVVVVPSRWDEPFGLTAVEGQACGCRVVAAHVGGLPEAAGAHSLFFPREDVASLAQQVYAAHMTEETPQAQRRRDAHLARFGAAAGRAAWAAIFTQME